MTGQRFSFRIRPWMATMFLTTATWITVAGCDLIPGHKEAEFRKQVEADSFPSANQAIHSPVGGNDNRPHDGN